MTYSLPTKKMFFACAVLCATAILIVAAAHAKKPTATFKDWRLFVEGAGITRICYLVGEPRQRTPRKARRGDVFISVTHRPGQGVRNEVSVRIGYPFSAASEPFARIGSDEFAFFTGVQAQNGADEWAWGKDIDAQPRLINAMKRGNELVFKGTSARGTLTTDSYSLSGFTAAMRRLDAACPK